MKLLLVEDQPSVAAFVKQGLAEEAFTVDHATTSRDALALATHNDYDALVVDRRLPDGDGLALVQALRARGKSAPVLVLSALAEAEQRVAGLDAGADDYLGKPFVFSELLARLRALLRRGKPTASPVYKVGDLEVDPVAHVARSNGKRLDLTPREFALLQLFARNPGATLSRTMIGERIWDYNFVPGSNIIEVYVRRLRCRIDGAGGKTTIHTQRGIGYRLEEPGG